MDEALTNPVKFSSNSVFQVSLDAFADVDLDGVMNGYVLAYNASNSAWEPADITVEGTVSSITAGAGLSGGTITSTGTIALDAGLGDLNNVDLTGVADNNVLFYNSSSGNWEVGDAPDTGVSSITAGTGLSGGTITSTGTISLNAALNDLSDVDTTGITNGQTIVYSGGSWGADDIPFGGVTLINTGTGLTGGPITSTGTISLDAVLDNLGDVVISSPSDGQTLVFDSGAVQWNNAAIPSAGVTSVATGTGLTGGPITSTGTISLDAALNDLSDVNTAGVTNGQTIVYSGGSWIPGSGSSNAFVNGGNTFGANSFLGPTDNYSLNIVSHGVEKMVIGDTNINTWVPLVIGTGAYEAGVSLKVTSSDSDTVLGLSTPDMTSAYASIELETTFGAVGAGYVRWYNSSYTGASGQYDRATALSISNSDGPITFLTDGATSDDAIEFYLGGNIALVIENTGDTRPGVNNNFTCGSATYRWSEVFATNGTINTSDRNKKTDIQTSDLGLNFIEKLNPAMYKWKDYDYKSGDSVLRKTHTRTHYGLIAQEVKDVLDSMGKDSKDFAGYIEAKESHPLTGERQRTYGLRYMEFISPIIKSVQELSAISRDIKNKIHQLKRKVIFNTPRS